MIRRSLLTAGLAILGLSACAAKADDRLTLPADMTAQLARLKAQPKFLPDAMYTGYRSEEHRPAAAKLVDDLIDKLQTNLPQNPSRAFLKQAINDTYAWFELSDTEDRERCAIYLEEILTAVGIPAPDGDINAWLDPFDPLNLLHHPHLEN